MCYSKPSGGIFGLYHLKNPFHKFHSFILTVNRKRGDVMNKNSWFVVVIPAVSAVLLTIGIVRKVRSLLRRR